MAQIISIQDLSAPELAAYSQLTNAQLPTSFRAQAKVTA